jgi:predicted DCC family thiol-disulfide oxidoreductase YuxK
MDQLPPITVYYDGGCPMCRAEIAVYQKSPGGAAIHWCDVTRSSPTELGADLSTSAALKRFHVRQASGALLSGAAAFAEVWRYLPRWKWIYALSRLPGTLFLMETAYRVFLRVRPLWRKA